MPTLNPVPRVPEVPHARDTSGASDVLARLHYEGLHLEARGAALIVSPVERLTDELRGLIRDHKTQILEALQPQQPVDMTMMFRAALQTGHLVVCKTCTRYSARPSRQPDGWCAKHGETWAAVPFDCPDYQGSHGDDC